MGVVILALCLCDSMGFAAPLSTPAISGVMKAGTPVEIIGEGFAGTEGPVALPDGSLLFTENRVGRVTRIRPDGIVSEFLTDSAGPNALALDHQGNIIAVLTTRPGLAIIYPHERASVLADHAEGKPFNRPNDLVIDRKGGIYFTDPGGRPTAGLARQTAIYYLSPKMELQVIDRSVEFPNGIQLSPDERTLYVADTTGEYVLSYAIKSDGTVRPHENYVRLAHPPDAATVAAGADGLALDTDGRLYVATALGVQVFSAKGKALGIIGLPKRPQNLAFAGLHKRDLFVVGQGTVYRIQTRTHGVLSRAK